MSQRLFAAEILSPSGQASDLPIDARKAALVFHALSPEDRAWVLSQLPSQQGRRLQALAEELASLGIPSDPGLLQGLIEAEPRTVSSARSGKGGSLKTAIGASIENADPAKLAQVLSNEQPGLIAYLLDGRVWPWEASLLQHLEAPLRSEVENRRKGSSAGSTPAGTATWSRLLALLEQRLAELRAPADASGAPSSSHVTRFLAKMSGKWRTRRAEDGRAAEFGGLDQDAMHPAPRIAQRRPISFEGES